MGLAITPSRKTELLDPVAQLAPETYAGLKAMFPNASDQEIAEMIYGALDDPMTPGDITGQGWTGSPGPEVDLDAIPQGGPASAGGMRSVGGRDVYVPGSGDPIPSTGPVEDSWSDIFAKPDDDSNLDKWIDVFTPGPLKNDVLNSTARTVPDQGQEKAITEAELREAFGDPVDEFDPWDMPGPMPDPMMYGPQLADGAGQTEPVEIDDGSFTGPVPTVADDGPSVADRKISELQRGDEASGGLGKSNDFRDTGFAPETRGKFLDWLGHDEQSGNRLGNSLMAAGGAILSSRAPHWSQALGEGVTAGTGEYQSLRAAGLREDADRARLDMAQQRMEWERVDRKQDRADKARAQALGVVENRMKGLVENPDGSFTYDPALKAKYNPKGAFDDLNSAGMSRVAAAEWLARYGDAFPEDHPVILAMKKNAYGGDSSSGDTDWSQYQGAN